MKQCIAIIILSVCTSWLQGQVPYNGSFEHVDLQCFPLLWTNVSNNNFYDIKTDTSIVFDGKRSLHVKPVDSVETPGMFVTLHQKTRFDQLPKQTCVKIVFYITLQDFYILDVYPYMRRDCSGAHTPPFKRKVEQVKKNNVLWSKMTYEAAIDPNCNWIYWGLIVRGFTDVYIDHLEIYYGDQLVKNVDNLVDYQYPDTRQEAAMQKSLKTISSKNADDLAIADLSFLKKDLAGAQVVALGESTHGTREFNILRQKVIDYLITKLDFSVIVFENDFSATLLASQLIAAGQTHQALDSFFTRIHQTTEIEQLLNIINKYNAEPGKKKISMYGCDIQNIQAPVLLLKRLLPENKALAARLDTLRNYEAHMHPNTGNTDTLLNMAEQINTSFWSDENATRSLQNRDLIQQVFRHLIDVCRFKKSIPVAYAENDQYAQIVRDSLMASHIQWIRQRHNNEKMIIWAHNSHIQKNETADPEAPFNHIKSMGAYLAEDAGKAYKAYALLVCSGTATGYTQYGKANKFSLLNPDTTCYEYYLRPRQGTVSFFNVQKYNLISHDAWLKGLKWRSIGYSNSPNRQFSYFHLKQKFDGIFTILSSTPAVSFYANK